MFPELVDHFQHILIDNSASWLRLNFSRVYQISFQNENFIGLQKFCNDIIAKHPRIIFDSNEFNNLQENALISLLKNDDLQMNESEIWDKVILWGKSKTPNLPPKFKEWTDDNFKSLKTTLHNCLPHIRYFQISGEDVIKKIKPYRNILGENTWDGMMSKLVAPNLSITSLILPPRSRDGFTGETFHRLCDNIPGTVVVVKINSTNEILGGYNPLIWKVGNNNYEYATTADSFIFSLKNGNLNESILSRVTRTSKAIPYFNSSQGPWFGNSGFGSNDDAKRWVSFKWLWI
ncbi:hypothetical protein C2G38_2060755 [Gigaspora rosea]|uniref:TLDc domain-containing protein n=1 Tax=Gigaspora rosea TaxID=44941 RepID=A0A397TQX8_9GLOM|nr:hypothetical protein C2G38_2130151 [Gigaspora rosea]RIB27890.1 hypothetical protein C2G38_2060755 [Gigaspora rosea]